MKTIMISLFFLAGLVTGCNNRGYDSLSTKEFAAVIAEEDVQLIDTRTPEEFAEGHIPGAINIDINSPDFDERISSLDKSRRVAVYCRGGRRSKEAAERIIVDGYEVVELNEGFLSWEGDVER